MRLSAAPQAQGLWCVSCHFIDSRLGHYALCRQSCLRWRVRI